jgi:hypothetical protein
MQPPWFNVIADGKSVKDRPEPWQVNSPDASDTSKEEGKKMDINVRMNEIMNDLHTRVQKQCTPVCRGVQY